MKKWKATLIRPFITTKTERAKLTNTEQAVSFWFANGLTNTLQGKGKKEIKDNFKTAFLKSFSCSQHTKKEQF